MRSRDLRTFTVEVKNKRRHAATPPASLWADAEAALLKPDAVPNGFGAGEPIEVRRGPSVGAAKADQPRRVLPDLRPAEPEPSADEEAGRDLRPAEGSPSGRPSRRGRSAAAQGAEPRRKRGPRGSERPASAPRTDAEAADAAFAGSAIIVAAAEVRVDGVPLAGQTPLIVVPADAERPARRWARRVEDLPRGERWKRRLPDVCR